jgi:hypothetical protein
MTAHIFVDETKRSGYLLAAAIVPLAELAASRRAVRSLLLGNQRRIHFKDERDARKRQILNTVVGLNLTVAVYECATNVRDLEARKACLRQLIPDVAEIGAARLVIERDDSLITHDRQTLYDAVAKAACRDTLQYEHLRAHEECLLSIADAVACAGRIGASGGAA